jgi:hypothetical protein
MRLGLVVLPERICGKVKGFGEGRCGASIEPKPDGFGANSPGPSGFRAADAHFVGPLNRCTTSTFASLRVDRRTARETELTIPNLILL